MATAHSACAQKHWRFIFENYTDEDQARLRSLVASGQCTYVIFGREVGANGVPYLQGFITFSPGRKRLDQCVEIVGQAHFTVTRQCAQAIAFCKKEGNWEEYRELIV